MTLAEAKLWCRVGTDTTDDALITALIVGAREACEHELDIALISQVWEQTIDRFPDRGIKLRAPLLGIVQVTYVDTAGATQTLPSNQYWADLATPPGWLMPAYNVTWPATRPIENAVTVRFSCGFGANAAAVPEEIKRWIKARISAGYDNRDAFARGEPVFELPGRFNDMGIDRWRNYA